jgi:hypothetical protein
MGSIEFARVRRGAGHGAITINECLHLLYTAYSPLPGLMEEVRATLIAMCDEQPTSKAVSIAGSPVGEETECQKV